MPRNNRKGMAVVSGGAGFIGSHLCARLLAEGYRVVCLDNLSSGRIENLQGCLSSPKFEFVKWDVTVPFSVAGAVNCVLHFASLASLANCLRYPIQTMQAGSSGTYNLLELARVKNSRFLLASTSEIYGDAAVHPQPENYYGNVNPCGPRAVYDEAKRFAEAMTMAFHRGYRLDVHIARIFNTYGPRMQPDDGRVVPAFIHRALAHLPLLVHGDGKQTRSFCYISDLVEGLYRLLESDEHTPVNLGNPMEISILELARKILHLTGSDNRIVFGPSNPDDPRRRRPDITLATRCLKWSPKVGLEQGLRATLDFSRSQLASGKNTCPPPRVPQVRSKRVLAKA